MGTLKASDQPTPLLRWSAFAARLVSQAWIQEIEEVGVPRWSDVPQVRGQYLHWSQRACWRAGVNRLRGRLYNALSSNTSRAFAYVTKLATRFKIYLCFHRRALPLAVTDQIEDLATSEPRLQIFAGVPQPFAI